MNVQLHQEPFVGQINLHKVTIVQQVSMQEKCAQTVNLQMLLELKQLQIVLIDLQDIIVLILLLLQR